MMCQLFCSAAAAEALDTITALTHTRNRTARNNPLSDLSVRAIEPVPRPFFETPKASAVDDRETPRRAIRRSGGPDHPGMSTIPGYPPSRDGHHPGDVDRGAVREPSAVISPSVGWDTDLTGQGSLCSQRSA